MFLYYPFGWAGGTAGIDDGQNIVPGYIDTGIIRRVGAGQLVIIKHAVMPGVHTYEILDPWYFVTDRTYGINVFITDEQGVGAAIV